MMLKPSLPAVSGNNAVHGTACVDDFNISQDASRDTLISLLFTVVRVGTYADHTYPSKDPCMALLGRTKGPVCARSLVIANMNVIKPNAQLSSLMEVSLVRQ